MKKMLAVLLALAVVSFYFGCKSNTPAEPSTQNTATITLTGTPVNSSTVTPTITATSTVTVTPTNVTSGLWNFEGTLEGWQVTTSVQTAFTSANYSNASYDSAPGAAAVSCNFTGTGGAATQKGRFFIDLTSAPVDVSAKSGVSIPMYIPAGLTDQTPAYGIMLYMKVEGGTWVNTGGGTLTSAGGWVNWCAAATSKPAGSNSLEGIMIEIIKADATADFNGIMYFDSIRVY